MKVPNISELEEVPTEQQRLDEIVAREQRLKEFLQDRKRTGLTDQEKEAHVAAVLAGQALPDDVDVEAEIKRALRELAAVQDAKHIAQGQLVTAQKAAARKICEALRPEHDKLQQKLWGHLWEAHKIHLELFAAERNLAGQGLGFNGLFDPDPRGFLGIPTDGSTDFAESMREAARKGYCKELPR
jgi:hypothetical protein